MDRRKNSDYFSIQPLADLLCNREGVFTARYELSFKYNSDDVYQKSFCPYTFRHSLSFPKTMQKVFREK